ncbi:MAG TPA: LysR family transcriptional regulator [Acetobacteraceae bacterium]|nr:LysR family transcriptional regulator [Acetobacteraceae bacterium]
METRDFRYFLKAVELESVSRAATALGITQPALSRQIQALEGELGRALLRRTGRGVQPTEAGVRFAAEAGKILAELDALPAALRHGPAAPSGLVSLALPASISDGLLPDLYATLRQRFPGIALRVSEAATGAAIELLKARAVDVAILHQRADFGRLAVERLIDEPLCLVSAAGRAISAEPMIPLAALERIDLILPTAASGLRALLEAEAARQGLKLSVAVELDLVAAIKNLVMAGLGHTVLPAFTVAREAAAGMVAVRRIGAPPLARRLVIGRLAHRPQSFATREVIASVRELAARHAATLG